MARATKPAGMRSMVRLASRLAFLACIACLANPAVAGGETRWLPEGMDTSWSAQFKLVGTMAFPEEDSPQAELGLEPKLDAALEVRAMNETYFGDLAYSVAHVVMALGAGDNRHDSSRLAERHPQVFPEGFMALPDDDGRLFDLTGVVFDGHDGVMYTRADRLYLGITPSWGEIRLGRQAVTWGHGFVFNPMDLFNPFTPTDVIRDYKPGDDMAWMNLPLDFLDEGEYGLALETVMVGRRNPDEGRAQFTHFTSGGRLSFFLGETNMEIMALRHYTDVVTGVGAAGYAGNAAWRADVTLTVLDEPSRSTRAYLSAVANVDYSWVWFGKNWYGFVELYYNGLSHNDMLDVYSDHAVAERAARGELYALGPVYGCAHLQVELHPLVNLMVTRIQNLADGSGVTQPYLTWSMDDNLTLTASGTFYDGGPGSEYGGFAVPGLWFQQVPSDTVALWLTYYW